MPVHLKEMLVIDVHEAVGRLIPRLRILGPAVLTAAVVAGQQPA
ncbi:MAG TPA: hypothetical protein VMV92_05605 [Streptosporangiaceae bacterium]|nr:hypothetical protein [Streptosporangiaceae bacterium]